MPLFWEDPPKRLSPEQRRELFPRDSLVVWDRPANMTLYSLAPIQVRGSHDRTDLDSDAFHSSAGVCTF